MASIPVEFDKGRMLKLLASLRIGQSVALEDEMHDYLAMAGACFMMASRHGPQLLKNRGLDWKEMPQEHQELREERLVDNMTAAITYYSHLCRMLCEGEYDEQFEDYHSAVVFSREKQLRVIPVSGVKKNSSPDQPPS